MRDAYGGILSLVLLVAFFVIVEGILGFLVSYTKAFRMKNYVIEAIEEYEGSDSCFKEVITVDSDDKTCAGKIAAHAEKLHYSPPNLHCPDGYTELDDFCYIRKDSSSGNYDVYSIVTQVDIEIPVIKNMLSLSFFQVHGDTRVIHRINR